MRIIRLSNNQRGDTILEVLIVIAVLSLILTISFGITNRSTQGNRQAQERSEAFKYTESQIELLKNADSTGTAIPTSGFFCIRDNKTIAVFSGVTTGNMTPENLLSTNFQPFNNQIPNDSCKKGDPNGAEYFTHIRRVGNDFTATTNWVRAGGNGVETATMTHRMYPQ